MLEPIGKEALPELRHYLEQHYRDNVIMLHDLSHTRRAQDRLILNGFAKDGEIVAVQGCYASGRWFPHFVDARAIGPLIQEARANDLRWIMGVERVVNPILDRLPPDYTPLGYDECDHIYCVDAASLQSTPCPAARCADHRDMAAIAHLRRCFDAEYFGSNPRRISQSWYLRVASHYVENGAEIAERDGRVVAMVATEALIPQIAHIGGVFTLPRYRGQGLATQVVSAICQNHLRHYPRVTLHVRKDNSPALRLYQNLGFAPWGNYRMARLR